VFDYYFVDLVYIGLVTPGFNFDFLSTSQEMAGKSISNMTYLVSSGTLNLNSVSRDTQASK